MATLQLWFGQNPEGMTRLVNMYGITETTVHATYRPLEQSDADLVGSPIGVRLPDLRVYLLNSDGQPVPIGVAGEIHIGGAGVARGYLNRPELTAERFLPDPYAAEPDARMYRTGDLARWLPDGNLEYIGRADFQVKIRGFRIELGEIEAALRGCQGIREAVVLAREDGVGDKRLVAYVTVAGSADTVAGDVDTTAAVADITTLPAVLKAHLQGSLPDYMLPAAFVVLEAFPLTPNGKLDRKALPAPEADAYATVAYAPPEGQLEEALAELWSELLGIERVGRHDDFFALGGHSLLAIRLISEIDQAFRGVGRFPAGGGGCRLGALAARGPRPAPVPAARRYRLGALPPAPGGSPGRGPPGASPAHSWPGWPANPGIDDGIGCPPSADLAPPAAQGPLFPSRPFLRRPGGV
jgi:hypothetical protein